MPRDQSGASAPHPLTDWVDHLARVRLAAKKARRNERKRRLILTQRLAAAERLLGHIIERADIIGHGSIPASFGDESATFLLVSLRADWLADLAAFGAELEDAEDSNDREATEADHGEPDTCDDEPAADPEPCEYGRGADRGIIGRARARYQLRPEPSRLGDPSSASTVAYHTTDPETGRAGAWVLQPRKAAGAP